MFYRYLSPLFILLCFQIPLAQSGEHITVYNWNDYIDPQVVQDFEKETGIGVDYRTFNTTQELMQSLRDGATLDVVVPAHSDLLELIDKHLLLPLDRTRLKNFGQLDKYLLRKLAPFDPGNRFAAPYLWGMIGLAINMPQAEAAYGGPLPNSWALLFEADSNAKFKDCGVSLLDAPEETFAALINFQGRSLSNLRPSLIQTAGEKLQLIRSNLRYIDSERYIKDLSEGHLCLSLAWVGDALKAAEEGQPVHFFIPEEGSPMFIDSLAIPAHAAHPELAYRFIDYLMRPEVAARNTTATFYPNAVPGSAANLTPAMRNDVNLFPDVQIQRRLFLLPPVSEKLQTPLQQAWQLLRK